MSNARIVTPIRISPQSSLFPWVLLSRFVSSMPPGTNRNRAEYALEMAAWAADDKPRRKRKLAPTNGREKDGNE